MFEILLMAIRVPTSSAQKRLRSRYSRAVCPAKGKLSLVSEKQIFLGRCFSLFFKARLEQREGFCFNQLAVRSRCLSTNHLPELCVNKSRISVEEA